MKKKRKRTLLTEEDYDRIKAFRTLSTEKKLDYLEELNKFVFTIMPKKSKKIWEELKKTH